MDCATFGWHQCQHLLEMDPHNIIHVRRYMSVMFFERHPICYLNFMFDQTSFTKVQVALGKQVFPFEQQFSGLFLLRFGPFPEALEIQHLQDPSLLGIAVGLLWSPCWEGHWWHLVGRQDLAKPQSLWGFWWNRHLSCIDRWVLKRTLNVTLCRSQLAPLL